MHVVLCVAFMTCFIFFFIILICFNVFPSLIILDVFLLFIATELLLVTVNSCWFDFIWNTMFSLNSAPLFLRELIKHVIRYGPIITTHKASIWPNKWPEVDKMSCAKFKNVPNSYPCGLKWPWNVLSNNIW